jgi:4-hydroxy-tetrahydrodipicolinate synthase
VDHRDLISKLQGCFLALPAIYMGEDLSLNLDAMRQHIRFLLDNGLREGNATFMANGASGEFPFLSLDERKQTVENAVRAADGQIAIIAGAQTLSTREAVEIARHAQSVGATALQVSPPFYYPPTDDDVYEHFLAIARAAPDVGIIAYNTYWLGYQLSLDMIERLTGIPQVVAVKWATPDPIDHQVGILRFSDRLGMIDNQLLPVLTVMLGGSGANLHPAMFWPEWGARIWGLLADRKWDEAQEEVNRLLLPYYEIIQDIERVTGGEGHIDKLALELIGLPGGRCRPPTRRLPPIFKERLRSLLLNAGAPLDRV